MASRNPNDLIPIVKDRFFQVQDICMSNGVDILLYCTLRTLEEQAILWRQSRSTKEINKRINILNKQGFDFLADIIIKVGPQYGPHVTNAYPGASWHNYGEAFDCVPTVHGKAIWNSRDPRWLIYGDAVKDAGLVWAGNWKSFKEYPHAQLSTYSNPLTFFKDKIGILKDELQRRGLLD